jgi:glycosyltransferase involved in cell wall biosynthesis
MVPVSVVIIAKNESHIIGQSIVSARLLTDDIIVVDNNSTDGTGRIAQNLHCRVFNEVWEGYGATKNKGNNYARHDWILSLDADEMIDDELINALHKLNYDDADAVYDIKFKTYFGNKLIRFGKWGNDHHIRLFNRHKVRWTELPVHETLLLPADISIRKIQGHIHHYSAKDVEECQQKAIYYASLSAKKYDANGKKSTFIKQYLSPCFNLLKNYIFLMGFMDGKEGWYIASNSAVHTWLKYHYLHELERFHRRNATPVRPKNMVDYSAAARTSIS